MMSAAHSPSFIVAAGGWWVAGGQGVDALREGIGLIREFWDTDTPGGVRLDGTYYETADAKRGPRPARDIGIWVGA